MHYCQQRKIAFVMPAKTGTTTFEHFLKLWELESVNGNRHIFYYEALDIKPDLADYKFIGFFRNPLERFLSICRYVYLTPSQKFSKFVDYPDDIYESYIDTVQNSVNSKMYISSPQVQWLQNADLLDYRNYEMEILKVARMFEQTKVTMIKANGTPPCNVVPSQRVIDFVQSYYEDDYRLGRERGLLA